MTNSLGARISSAKDAAIQVEMSEQGALISCFAPLEGSDVVVHQTSSQWRSKCSLRGSKDCHCMHLVYAGKRFN